MYTASEKLAIIRLVEDSELSIRRTLTEINVSRSSFYHPDKGGRIHLAKRRLLAGSSYTQRQKSKFRF